MLHFTDLVLLEVPKVWHVQVIIVRLGFTLAATSATAAEAATAEVTARQQAAHSEQGLKVLALFVVILRHSTLRVLRTKTVNVTLFLSCHPWRDANFIF